MESTRWGGKEDVGIFCKQGHQQIKEEEPPILSANGRHFHFPLIAGRGA